MHQSFDYDDLYCKGYGVDPDVVRERLGMLKFEQDRLIMPTSHPLNFKCQCTACVRMHTITMQDKTFLKSIKVIWNASPISEQKQEQMS